MKIRSLIAITTLFMLFSCNKISNTDPGTNIDLPKDYVRSSGYIPDPPESFKNFKLQVSKDFLEHGRATSFDRTGKKIIDVRADELESYVSAQAAKGPKNNGGGGSTGGGGTTTNTDWTPPMLVVIAPTNGQVFDLSTFNNANQTDLIASVYDNVKLVRVKLTVNNVVLKDSIGTFIQGYGNYNTIRYSYNWPFGDGTYTMVWQAWDAAGNTTITNTVFSRNTKIMTLPDNFPSSTILPWPKVDKYIYQGGEGACAAFSVANAYGIQKYVRGGLTGGYNDNNMYSPEWIYNISLAGTGYSCGAGSTITGNIGIVVNRGVPTWSYLPFDYMNGCDTLMFTNAIRTNAAQNKGTYGFMTPSADYTALKYNISRGYVGIFAFQIDHQINYAWPSPDFIWTFPHYRDGGSHTCILIGYDDSKHAFLMLNSWSINWANQGAMWVDYDFFYQQVTGACYYFAD